MFGFLLFSQNMGEWEHEYKLYMNGKSLNKNLHSARTAKTDEFYTQLVDIEKELKKFL